MSMTKDQINKKIIEIEDIDDLVNSLITQSQFENPTTCIFIRGMIDYLAKKKKNLISQVNRAGDFYTSFDSGVVR